MNQFCLSLGLILISVGCSTLPQAAKAPSPSGLEVGAKNFATKERRASLDGKLVYFRAFSSVSKRDRGGFLLRSLDGSRDEVFLALYSVGDQKEARALAGTNGKIVVVEGQYSDTETSPAAGVHSFGVLESAKLLWTEG